MENQEGTPIHDSWREMQKKLKAATHTNDVLAMIQVERDGLDRGPFIHRMIGRYRVLRKAEDDALLASIMPRSKE